MKKNKRKNVIALSLITAILLAGCSGKKKEVDYSAESSQTDATENNNDGLSGQTIYWEEEIDAGTKKVLLKDDFVYPDISAVCITDVKERYLTPEEIKNLITYFIPEEYYDIGQFDAGYYIENLEHSKEKFSTTTSYTNAQEVVDYIDELIENIPSDEEVKANFTNLPRGHVVYEYDGYMYEFSFCSDPGRNESSFRMSKDADYIYEGMSIQEYMELTAGMEQTGPISDVMSAEEAIDQAEALCKELNLGNFIVSEISDRDNRYEIMLTRNMNGVPMDPVRYVYFEPNCYDDNYIGKVLLKDIPYGKEYVRVDIGVDGIQSLTVEGLMEDVSMKENIKLLDLEQIKNVVKQYVVEAENVYDMYLNFRFTYLRIAGENPDEYSYIPVWILAPKQVPFGESAEYNDLFFVNAIDGSLIDILNDGAIEYDLRAFYY